MNWPRPPASDSRRVVQDWTWFDEAEFQGEVADHKRRAGVEEGRVALVVLADGRPGVLERIQHLIVTRGRAVLARAATVGQSREAFEGEHLPDLLSVAHAAVEDRASGRDRSPGIV